MDAPGGGNSPGLWFFVTKPLNVDQDEVWDNLLDHPPIRALQEAPRDGLKWAQFPPDMAAALTEAEQEHARTGETWVKLRFREWAYLSPSNNLLVYMEESRRPRMATRVRKAP